MKTSIDLVKTKLEAKLTGKVKSFYIGDPYILPESVLPAILLTPVRTDTNIVDNQRDSHIHYIDISLVIDARQYFGVNPKEMVGTSFLMETMENELTDGTLDPSSVLHILRKNMQNLGTNRYIQNIESIDYTVRKRSEDLITLEAIAHISVEYILSRPT